MITPQSRPNGQPANCGSYYTGGILGQGHLRLEFTTVRSIQSVEGGDHFALSLLLVPYTCLICFCSPLPVRPQVVNPWLFSGCSVLQSPQFQLLEGLLFCDIPVLCLMVHCPDQILLLLLPMLSRKKQGKTLKRQWKETNANLTYTSLVQGSSCLGKKISGRRKSDT